MQLYPDPESTGLRAAIAAYHGLAAGNVFLGNGSDEVLAHAFFTSFQQGSPLLKPDISYAFYSVYPNLYGISVETVPLTDSMAIDVDAYEWSAQNPVAGVVIANPDAPTGIGLATKNIEALLKLHPHRVVLVDEAYVDFGGESAIPLISRYPNLLVVHTLSKSRSLAGLRIGFACGQLHLIEALTRVKDSFNAYPLDRLPLPGELQRTRTLPIWSATVRRLSAAGRGCRWPWRILGSKYCHRWPTMCLPSIPPLTRRRSRLD